MQFKQSLHPVTEKKHDLKTHTTWTKISKKL